jgi:hypothetical protein
MLEVQLGILVSEGFLAGSSVFDGDYMVAFLL